MNTQYRNDTTKTLSTIAFAALIAFALVHTPLFLWLALALLFLTIFDNPLSHAIAAAWMKCAHIIGTVNSKILLGAIFFFFLTPLALLFRIFNKKLTYHFFIKKPNTYFEDVTEPISKKSFEQMF